MVLTVEEMKMFLLKLRKVLGKLTDLLIKGRQAGLWTEKNNVSVPKENPFKK